MAQLRKNNIKHEIERKRLAMSLKWDIVRQKREILLAEKNHLIERNDRAAILAHMIKFHLAISRFRKSTEARKWAAIVQMKLIFLINTCKIKCGRAMRRFRPTVEERI